MPLNNIVVRPSRDRRVAFARWAVAQTPKLRTVSTIEFAVPARLFADVPEDLLRGSLVDGHAYVSPLDHEEETETETEAGVGVAGPGAPELLGVATAGGFLESVPGQPLPEVPASAYGPDSVPLPADFAPLEDAPEDDEPDAALTGDAGRPFPCGSCARAFRSERGRASHRRQIHGQA